MKIGYMLSVPLGHGHWATLVSNKPLEPQHFAMLDRYLEVQKEIAAEGAACDSGRHPKGENSRSEVEGEACQSGAA